MTGMDAVMMGLGLALAGIGESNHPARLAETAAPASVSSRQQAEPLPSEERRIEAGIGADRSDSEVIRPAAVRTAGSAGRVFLALAAVLGLIGGGVLLLRRFVPRVRRYSSGQIEVLARTFLSSKQSVALVRVGQRAVLIGVCPESVSCLTVIDDPGEVAMLRSHSAGHRAGAPSETFERYVQEEAAAYTRTSEVKTNPADDAGNAHWYARNPSGLTELLAKVRAKLQQV